MPEMPKLRAACQSTRLRHSATCWYDLLQMLPELGRIGPLILNTYTILLDAAIVIGLAALARQGRRLDARPTAWLDAGLIGAVTGIIAGRLGHVAVHWNYFSTHPADIYRVWLGGIEWHAAIVGALGGLALGCRVRRVSFRRSLDVLALVLPLGAALVFAGCYATRCGYGREVATLAGTSPLLVGELPDVYGVVAPRLASQLYGMALSLAMLALAALLPRWIKRTGVRGWIVLSLLALGVFGIGFTRGDEMPMVIGVRLDQVFDLAIMLVGGVGAVLAWRQAEGDPALLPTEAW